MTDIEKISPLKISASRKQSVSKDWSDPFGDASIFKYEPDSRFRIVKGVENVKTKDDVVKLTGFSADYIDSLIEFEGLKLEEYKDAAGIRTIGIGHNIETDSSYIYGKRITEQRAYKLLAKDLLSAKKALNNILDGVKLDRGEQEAIVDLIFNVGARKIENTKLIEHIKSGNKEKALSEFDFIYVGRNVNKHLCERRVDNIVRFCGGKYPRYSKPAVEQIVKKGKHAIDKKIRNSGFLKRMYYQYQKNLFISKMNEVLARYKND